MLYVLAVVVAFGAVIGAWYVAARFLGNGEEERGAARLTLVTLTAPDSGKAVAATLIVRDPATRTRLKDMHEWTWMLDTAPLVVAVLGNDEGDPWWIEDCAAAAENILLEATSLGLGSVWCGMREAPGAVVGYERSCREVLGIPQSGWRTLALIGIGHPAEKKKPRTQRQVSKVSYERFGQRSR